MAAQIIHWASLSDLIHFEITDISLSVLPSGRLGAHHADLTDARGRFLPQYIQGEIGRNTKTFLSSWRISNQVQDIEIVDELLKRMDDAVLTRPYRRRRDSDRVRPAGSKCNPLPENVKVRSYWEEPVPGNLETRYQGHLPDDSPPPMLLKSPAHGRRS